MPRPEREEQIEGRRPVLEALTGDRVVRRVLVARTAQGDVVAEIERLARDRGVEVQKVDPRSLDQVSRTGTHQGVIALAGPRPTADVDDLLERSRRAGEPPFFVLLDGIQDPQNTGAIIRVADAAGAHGVIVPQRRASGLTPAVARASAGAVEHLPVAQVTNLARTMEDLKKAGVWVAGADLSGEDLFRAGLELPLAVVIGSEGRGLSRLVKEHCDRLVRIPMYGRVGSLNAATAAAVILFEIRRRCPR
jgi:23S rRNA (guanosine2251-2'-O)-methyltransferase